MAKTILLLCSGNTCRSPMAQALLWKKLKEEPLEQIERIEVVSAGVFSEEGLPASWEAIEVMREEGLDLSDHRSRQLTAQMIEEADLVLTMTSYHRNYILGEYPQLTGRIFTLGEFLDRESYEIFDPYGQGKEAYQQCLDQFKELSDELIFQLKNWCKI